jgi:plasmid stability protein
MIQLRNVPDSLHRKLKARAALEGLSLSDFLTREARKIADQPTDEEIRARLAARPVLNLSPSPTQIVREERDRR